MNKRLIQLLMGLCLICACSTLSAQNEPVKYRGGKFDSSEESLKQYKVPEWFRDAKFGIWSHWGPQAVPREGDWYARGMYDEGSRQYKYHLKTYGHPSKFGFKDIINLWKAERWNPEELMKLYKRVIYHIHTHSPLQ